MIERSEDFPRSPTTDHALPTEVLAAIVDECTDIIVVAAMTGEISYLNESARRQLNRPRCQASSVPTLKDVVSPTFAPVFAEQVLPAVTRSGMWCGNGCLAVRGGEPLFVSLRVQGVPAVGGSTQVIVHARDLRSPNSPELKNISALPSRESDARFTAIFEQASVGVAHADSITGEFIEVNRAYAGFLGVAPEDLNGMTFMDVTYPGDLALDLHKMDQLRRGEIRQFTIEKRYLLRDNTSRWVNLTVSPMWQPGESPTTHVAVIEDITERKIAEGALRDNTSLFRTLAGVAPVGIFRLDESNRCIYANDRCVELAGLSRGKIMDSGWIHQIHGDDRDRVAGALDDLVHSSQTFREEFSFVHPCGRQVFVIAEARPVLDDRGGAFGFIGTMVDITERHAAEIRRHELEQSLRQAQKMEAIGRLAGGVAHDFNNLLSVIVGHSDLLLDETEVGSPTWESLEEIRKAGDQGASLTQRLLAFSRNQASKRERVSINEVVCEFDGMLRRLIGEDLELVVELGARVPQIEGDADQLGQALVNLAVNSRDAMPDGGRLVISTGATILSKRQEERHPDAPMGAYAVLRVSDTGTGMDRDTQSRIFEPFFTTKSREKGTGLGLSIVYGTVRQCGGFVAVETEEGEGTTMELYFPEAINAVEASTETLDVPSGVSMEGTILLVEDDPGVRRLTARVLKRHGFEVLAAEHPGDACRIVEAFSGQIDLVLTDVVMPHMSGPEFAEWMAKERPQAKVLYMSGYTEDVIADRGIKGRHLSILQKPFHASTLIESIRSVLNA